MGLTAGSKSVKTAGFNWYIKTYCNPVNPSSWTGYIGSRGQLYHGYRRGPGPRCYTNKILLAAAQQVIRNAQAKNPNLVVRGLDGYSRTALEALGDVQVIRSGRLARAPMTFVPNWPDGRYGNNTVQSAKVLRTKLDDGGDLLTVEAGCASGGHFMIDNPNDAQDRVNSRAAGLKRKDRVYWISTRSPGSSTYSQCEFIGKGAAAMPGGEAATEAYALRDVMRKGVSSAYFRFHPNWTIRQIPANERGTVFQDDVAFAKKNKKNALAYFLRPTNEARALRDAYFRSMRNAQAVRYWAKDRPEEAAFARAVRVATLTNQLPNFVPAMSLNTAANIVRGGGYEACSVARIRVLDLIAGKAEEKAIQDNAVATANHQLSLLEEAGLTVVIDGVTFFIDPETGDAFPTEGSENIAEAEAAAQATAAQEAEVAAQAAAQAAQAATTPEAQTDSDDQPSILEETAPMSMTSKVALGVMALGALYVGSKFLNG